MNQKGGTTQTNGMGVVVDCALTFESERVSVPFSTPIETLRFSLGRAIHISMVLDSLG